MITPKTVAKIPFFRISVFALWVSTALVFIDAEQVLSAKRYQPKSPVNQQEPGGLGERTLPQPAQPEANQPPPDVVGKVPKDLKKAARKKETEKLVTAKHRHL